MSEITWAQTPSPAEAVQWKPAEDRRRRKSFSTRSRGSNPCCSFTRRLLYHCTTSTSTSILWCECFLAHDGVEHWLHGNCVFRSRCIQRAGKCFSDRKAFLERPEEPLPSVKLSVKFVVLCLVNRATCSLSLSLSVNPQSAEITILNNIEILNDGLAIFQLVRSHIMVEWKEDLLRSVEGMSIQDL